MTSSKAKGDPRTAENHIHKTHQEIALHISRASRTISQQTANIAQKKMELPSPKALSYKGRDGPCLMHIETLQGLSKNTSVKIYVYCAHQRKPGSPSAPESPSCPGPCHT